LTGFQFDLMIIQKWLTSYWATLYKNSQCRDFACRKPSR